MQTIHAGLRDFILPLIAIRNRKKGYAVSIIKAGMKVIGRDSGPVRPPLTDLTEQEMAELAALVAELPAVAIDAAGRRITSEATAAEKGGMTMIQERVRAGFSGAPVVTAMQVIPVAGRDSMLLNLSGAHAPFFTRNLVILTDNSGHTGVGEVPGGEKIRQTLEDARDLVVGQTDRRLQQHPGGDARRLRRSRRRRTRQADLRSARRRSMR